MMTKNGSLQALIIKICDHPEPDSPERRRLLNHLLMQLQQLPGIRRSSHPDYLEALDRTWEWVGGNIHKFEPRSDEPIAETLTRWINGHLQWRIQDLWSANKLGRDSLDRKVTLHDADSITLLEWVPDTSSMPTLSGLDAYLAKCQSQAMQALFQRFEDYIEQDPEGKLRNCHPRKHPRCHCQLLCQQRLLQHPPKRLADISREQGINYQTLNSHWEKKCIPLLQDVLVQLGYSRAQFQSLVDGSEL